MLMRLLTGGSFYFFFFQAEDGIRDLTVTGVQTCALPISLYANPRATVDLDFVIDPEHFEKADRKSTRLNSSHSQISYAVFCLKKKKKTEADRKCILINISPGYHRSFLRYVINHDSELDHY